MEQEAVQIRVCYRLFGEQRRYNHVSRQSKAAAKAFDFCVLFTFILKRT
jgi:hypothetical protein